MLGYKPRRGSPTCVSPQTEKKEPNKFYGKSEFPYGHTRSSTARRSVTECSAAELSLPQLALGFFLGLGETELHRRLPQVFLRLGETELREETELWGCGGGGIRRLLLGVFGQPVAGGRRAEFSMGPAEHSGTLSQVGASTFPPSPRAGRRGASADPSRQTAIRLRLVRTRVPPAVGQTFRLLSQLYPVDPAVAAHGRREAAQDHRFEPLDL